MYKEMKFASEKKTTTTITRNSNSLIRYSLKFQYNNINERERENLYNPKLTLEK